jgi:hypothetical protein
MLMGQCPKTADQTMVLPTRSLGCQYAAAAALQVGRHCGRCDEPQDQDEGWAAVDHGGAVAGPGTSWVRTSDEVDRTSVAAAVGSIAVAVVALASAYAALLVALA